MRTALRPPHLLLLHHPSADDLIDRRFSERGGDRLAVAIPVPLVGDKRFVHRNIAPEFVHGLP
jgi:hypothetical protein